MFAGLTASFGPTVLRGINNAYNALTGRNRVVFAVEGDHAASFTYVNGWKTSLNPIKNIQALGGPLPDGTSWFPQEGHFGGVLASGPANLSGQPEARQENPQFTVVSALADRTSSATERPDAVTELSLDLDGQTVADPYFYEENVVENGAYQERDGVRIDCEPGDTTQREVRAQAVLPSGRKVTILKGTLAGCAPAGKFVINRTVIQGLSGGL